MKYVRRSISIILVVTILLLFSFNAVQADSGVIYETSSKQTITSGAVLEKITRFTDEGWLNINVLKVDLSNKNIAVDAITNSSSIKNLSNVKALAQSKGAVAAINASFFSWMADKTNGYPDGSIVENGKIVTASSEYNKYSDSMASFSIDNLNQVLFDYWKTDVSLVAPNGNTANTGQFNKPSKDYTDYTIIDRHWSDFSIGVSQEYPDIVEMVVDNSKVVEIRTAQPPVQIPANGYVVVTRQAGAAFLNENLKPGDTVNMNISTTPDWTKLKMSLTGSALLVKDGKIPPKFSFNITGNYARTAVGSSKDGTQLILATVDGRINSNVGMTQEEMAQLMVNLGAYNALNLDGGGSTTMVARKPGSNEIELQNTPSDGCMRSVAAALGIFSIAPPSSLDGLLIEADDANVFVNTSREFTVRGYDRYFNPVQIDPSKVKWSVSGIEGRFEGNVFYPKTVGEGKIKAKLDNVSAEFDISVLSSPVKLEFWSKSLNFSPNETISFLMHGKNANGYKAIIRISDINWKANGTIGEFKNNILNSSSGGTGYIDASVGNIHAYCAVTISSSNTQTAFDLSKLPKDTEPVDPDNKAIDYQKASDSFRFSVAGQFGNPKNLLEKLMYVRMSDKINNYLDVSAFIGGPSEDSTRLVKTPFISTSSGYESVDFKNSRLIQLDASKNGLRASKPGQWSWFIQQLNSFNGNNVFIFMDRSLQNFSDAHEADLLQDTLTNYKKKTGKNVWVFYKGNEFSSYMNRGIKFVSTDSIIADDISAANTASSKYILVTVKGNSITYEYKPVITQ